MKNNKLIKQTIKSYLKIANKYSKAHSDIKEIKNIADFFLKNLKGKKILDVGCGPGRDAKYFSEKGYKVIGIDLATNFLRIAREKAPKAKFIKMDIRNLKFPENTFDGLWACGSFLHVPKNQAKKTLIGFKKILKQKGLLYLGVIKGQKKRVSEHLIFYADYTKEEIKKLVRDCGFKIIKIIIEHKKVTWIDIFARKK